MRLALLTGAVLLGFALGWAVLASVSARSTDHPQRWAWVPTAFMGAGGLVLLATSGDELLACAQLDRDGAAAHFGMFSVRPALQGAGTGRAMLAEAERIARDEWRCGEMQMSVISIRDELIAWYERRGYRRTGRYEPFPYGDQRFGIPRRDDLRFEILVKPL